MKYSIIVPVFNRPDHIHALLACLVKQTFADFEVLVVESGSSIKSDLVVEEFKSKLNIRYFFKGNDGQGFSRNYGMKNALGDYFIILDSDILVPDQFVENVDAGIKKNKFDAYGGPDRLHPEANDTQKAVDYCMTSMLTTGGTRGKANAVGKFYPRSFNMGVSKAVFEKTQGYKIPFLGEDIEWSRRIMAAGFSTGLIEEAYIFHERKKTISGFYKQMHWFGRARINIFSFYPDTLKLVHFLPLAYAGFQILALLASFLLPNFIFLIWLPILVYHQFVFLDATRKHNSLKISALSTWGACVLMWAYALGMLKGLKDYILKKSKATNFSDKNSL